MKCGTVSQAQEPACAKTSLEAEAGVFREPQVSIMSSVIRKKGTGFDSGMAACGTGLLF